MAADFNGSYSVCKMDLFWKQNVVATTIEEAKKCHHLFLFLYKDW